MQEKLQTITSMKDKLPAEAIGQLSESVDQLDAGMQGLNIAIGTFSSNLGELNKSVQAQFPAAVTGILELNGGFSQLSANNDALLAGANKLKANSSDTSERNKPTGKRTKYTGKPDVIRSGKTFTEQRSPS